MKASTKTRKAVHRGIKREYRVYFDFLETYHPTESVIECGVIPEFFRTAILKANDSGFEDKELQTKRLQYIAQVMDAEYGCDSYETCWTNEGIIESDGIYHSGHADQTIKIPRCAWQAGFGYADKWGDIKLFMYDDAVLGLYDESNGDYITGSMC